MFTLYKAQGVTLLLVLSLAVSESKDDPEQDAKKTVDPVSNFFSELGDLFLDVDKAIAVQSQPKVEHEANIMSQLLKPRPDYFNRIQTNYKDMQKRLGRLIGNTIGFKNTYSDHELSTVSPPLESSSIINPDHNPFAEAAEARKEKLKQKLSKGSSHDLNKDFEKLFIEPGSSIPETVDKSFKAFGQFSKEIIDNIQRVARESSSLKSTDNKKFSTKRTGSLSILEECSNEVLEDPDLEKRRQEKCSSIAAEERIRADLRKLMLEPKRATEALFSKNIETFDKLTKDILSRSGDVMENKILDTDDKHFEAELDLESIDECSEALEDATLSSSTVEKCSRKIAEANLIGDLNKIVLSKESSEKLIPVGLKTIDDVSSFLIKRSGDTEDQSLEDNLSSVSYDTQIRQLIKDHGSWILDYPLIKLWRERDRTDGKPADQNSNEDDLTTVENLPDVTEVEPTELYMPVSTDYEMDVQKSGESVPDNYQSSYYTIVNEDGDILEEDIDFVYQPESLSNDIESIEIERQEQKETIILAFTSDGVPLKLRLGPEIDNPLQYLHKALKSAGVSLNVPVESYDDLEPVGKEVLKLGSGILTRAVLINVSNTNELKSLLKALMSYQSSGKTTL